MDTRGYDRIPLVLCHWISFLTQALPLRSVPTFLELLIGALLSRRGFVTEAWLAVSAQRHWTSYYKWLQRGRWSWVRLGQALGRLLCSQFVCRVWYWVIDDSVTCRASSKAPASGYHYNHSRKPNRPTHVQGQCWVNLSVVLGRGRRICSAIPLLWRLQRRGGNSSKLRSACVLIRALRPVFSEVRVRLLLDCWYMRRLVIEYALSWEVQVIGQVRHDTALYALPEPVEGRRRGRKRLYGLKYTPEQVAALPEVRVKLWLYGKPQWVRYRSVQAKARFLKGRLVRVVWVQFEDPTGRLSKPRLLLATEAGLRPEVIIKAYARRWPVEPMFNVFRHSWGWIDVWQQSRQVLARWVQILSVSYALVQLLVVHGGPTVSPFAYLTPWRVQQPLTAGRVRLGLQRIFGQVNVRAWWDPKSRKFRPPDETTSTEPATSLAKVA